MRIIFILSILALPLTACGVKPSSVEGKPGHPRTYPDITVDTTPRGGHIMNNKTP